MNRQSSLKKLLPFVRAYRRRLVLGLLLVMGSAAVSVAVPYFIRIAVDLIELRADLSGVMYCGLAIVGCAALRAIMLFRGRYGILGASWYVGRDLRNALFRHLCTLPVGFFDRTPSGEIFSRVINDTETVRHMIGFGCMVTANMICMFAFGSVMMFILNWKLALISMGPLVLVLVVVFVTQKQMYERSTRVQERLADISTFAQENFGGIRVVKNFTQEEEEIAKFGVRCQNYFDESMGLARVRSKFNAGIMLFGEIGLVLTLLVGGAGVMNGTFTKGEFTAFTVYQMMMIWPAIAMGWIFVIIQRGLACNERLWQLLETEPEPGLALSDGHPLEGRIEIRGLTFAYETAPVLRDVSLTVEPGEHVAIVGRVGAGKSTLVNLLMRLYQASPGTILIDGRNLESLPPQTVRRLMAVVPQDNFLFSATVKENVALGATDETIDGAAIVRACEIGQFVGDIERFPNRYEQVIGERGIMLSGGQKQRLSIARAVLRQAKILVLDDAFSSVDSNTEEEIVRGLRQFGKGRTLILVTHRLSSVRSMDKIVVMEEGRVVEVGRHDALMQRGGAYAKLYEHFMIARELMSA